MSKAKSNRMLGSCGRMLQSPPKFNEEPKCMSSGFRRRWRQRVRGWGAAAAPETAVPDFVAPAAADAAAEAPKPNNKKVKRQKAKKKKFEETWSPGMPLRLPILLLLWVARGLCLL
jgi:hypothetical protein